MYKISVSYDFFITTRQMLSWHNFSRRKWVEIQQCGYVILETCRIILVRVIWLFAKETSLVSDIFLIQQNVTKNIQVVWKLNQQNLRQEACYIPLMIIKINFWLFNKKFFVADFSFFSFLSSLSLDFRICKCNSCFFKA